MEMEKDLRIDPNYIRHHPALTWENRRIAVDLGRAFAHQLRTIPEVFYLAIPILDRYASVTENLTLLEYISAMRLSVYFAAELEELNEKSFVRYGEYAGGAFFDRKEGLALQNRMLNALGYKLYASTPSHFIDELLMTANSSEKPGLTALAHYITQIALIHEAFLSVPPSTVSCAAVYLARRLLKLPPWTKEMNYEYVPPVDQLEMMAGAVNAALSLADTLGKNTYNVYSSSNNMRASPFVAQELKKNPPTKRENDSLIQLMENTY